jgi:hypothetical protein
MDFRAQAHSLLDGGQSFIRNIRSFAVSWKATKFFRIGAYFADLGSWTT